MINLKGNITTDNLFNDIYGFGINSRSETIIKLSRIKNLELSKNMAKFTLASQTLDYQKK